MPAREHFSFTHPNDGAAWFRTRISPTLPLSRHCSVVGMREIERILVAARKRSLVSMIIVSMSEVLVNSSFNFLKSLLTKGGCQV